MRKPYFTTHYATITYSLPCNAAGNAGNVTAIVNQRSTLQYTISFEISLEQAGGAS